MSDALHLPAHGGVIDIIEMSGREVVACDSFVRTFELYFY